MHYLPLLIHSDTAEKSLQSPFYYAFDGQRLAVCFCTEKDFAFEQIENSRAQHFTEEYMAKEDGHWGVGVIEFGSIEQVVLFVQKWSVLVPTKIGILAPTSLALWKEGEPHRYIKFEDIFKQAAENA